METAALVDRSGSIDWLCWPDFSSAACFAALLGTEENGCWKIAPAEGEFTTTRRYRDHTLILETTFEQARRRHAPHRFHASARNALRCGAHR